MTFDRTYLDRYWDLILTLTQKEIRVRYKNYSLGYVWSLAQPLAFAAVFYFAFKVAMKAPIEDFVFFLLAGLFPWQWLANSINASPTAFLNNASIIKKVSFPRHTVVVSVVLQDAIHFAVSLPILLGVALFHGQAPSWAWLAGLPLIGAVQMAFITGVALVLASVNMFFRDLERLVTLSTMLLFYFTPIVYSPAQLPERVRHWMVLNPAADLVGAWRALFMEGRLDWAAVSWASLHAALALAVGMAVYRRLAPRFAEAL